MCVYMYILWIHTNKLISSACDVPLLPETSYQHPTDGFSVFTFPLPHFLRHQLQQECPAHRTSRQTAAQPESGGRRSLRAAAALASTISQRRDSTQQIARLTFRKLMGLEEEYESKS